MTFPTITTSTICEDCDGDGLTTRHDGSLFDPRAEQYYPTETTTPCEECDGTGEILTTHCCICGDLETDCICTEDDLDAWNTFEVAA